MMRGVQCPDCGHKWLQKLPDLTAAEAEALKDAGDDSEVQFSCPSCGKNIHVLRRRLLDPPP